MALALLGIEGFEVPIAWKGVALAVCQRTATNATVWQCEKILERRILQARPPSKDIKSPQIDIDTILLHFENRMTFNCQDRVILQYDRSM